MGRLALRDIIAKQRAASRTVFFSSHVLSDVEAVCDHLVILDGGKIAYEGPVTKLLEAGADAPVLVAFDGASLESLAKIESAAGARPEKRGDHFELVVKDRAAGDRAIEAVRASGARLVSYQPRLLTLEDYFLKTYGKKKEGVA
jgi:ABC-2 type transport system ATP-binding protein